MRLDQLGHGVAREISSGDDVQEVGGNDDSVENAAEG